MTELGTRLREAREERQISLEDLQRITKIQKRYLVGIEEGNYQVMPGKFYVRAFIKQYAEAVGLDPELLFDEFKSEIPGTYNEDLPEQISRVRTRRQISSKGSKIIDLVPKVLTLIVIIGLFMGIYWFLQNRDLAKDPNKTEAESEQTQYDESKDPPPDSKDKKDEAKEEDNSSKEESGDASTGDADTTETDAVEEEPIQDLVQTEKGTKTATYELKNSSTFTVEISAKAGGAAWVDIRNKKGHKFVYKTLKDGEKEQIDLSNETEVIFNIGRTSDLEVKINGQLFEYPFAPGDVVQQIITIIYTPTVSQ